MRTACRSASCFAVAGLVLFGWAAATFIYVTAPT